MISVAQRNAIRGLVLAALEMDDDGQPIVHPNAAYPQVLPAAVYWSEQDPPRSPDGPRVILTVIGTDERAPTEDSDVPESGVLETRYRELLDVTLGIRCNSRRSTTAPSASQDADQILRRIWSRVHSRSLGLALQAVGVATTRRGTVASLPRIARGSQWETAASFALIVRISPIVVERPGHIERVAGTGTIDPPPTMPFDADATP